SSSVFLLLIPPPPRSTLFPYTTLFRSYHDRWRKVRSTLGGWNAPPSLRRRRPARRRQRPGTATGPSAGLHLPGSDDPGALAATRDRKSTRLNSSHVSISYAVFCLKKKN